MDNFETCRAIARQLHEGQPSLLRFYLGILADFLEESFYAETDFRATELIRSQVEMTVKHSEWSDERGFFLLWLSFDTTDREVVDITLDFTDRTILAHTWKNHG